MKSLVLFQVKISARLFNYLIEGKLSEGENKHMVFVSNDLLYGVFTMLRLNYVIYQKCR